MYVSMCVCLNLATSIVYILVYICMIMMQEHTIEHRKADADVLPGEETTG